MAKFLLLSMRACSGSKSSEISVNVKAAYFFQLLLNTNEVDFIGTYYILLEAEFDLS